MAFSSSSAEALAAPAEGLSEHVVRARGHVSTFHVPSSLQFIKAIGAGSYGIVASFADTRDSSTVAVKKITDAFNNLEDGKRILRELKVLQELDHTNIIKIRDIFPPQSPNFDDIYIVTDLMDSDLRRIIASPQALSEEHVQFFTYQIFLGLAYLHSRNIIHRDLTPGNVLVNKECDVKICDFGLARAEQEGLAQTEYVVTRWYRAPEVMLHSSRYSRAIDVWGAGCIHGELINRTPLFTGKDYVDQVSVILRRLGTPSESELRWLPLSEPESDNIRKFLKMQPPAPKADFARLFPTASPAAHCVLRCALRIDPTARAAAHELLRQPYFTHLFLEQDLDFVGSEQPIDWSFDDFEPTKPLLQKFVYRECARFHPELLERASL